MSESISPTPSCADTDDFESISTTTALAQIAQQVSPLKDTETLPIRECLGRINAHTVQSPLNLPNYPNSAMDGIAVAFSSLKTQGITELHAIGTAYAGIPFDGVCGNRECVRIMTGAVIPEGTDTVIMQEQIETNEQDLVRVTGEHRAGENLRQAGEDVYEKQLILNPGVTINPANLGVLASLGIMTLEVIRKPVVAFFSTGDELVTVGKPLKKGKIYDSNRYSLFGLLSRLPVESLDMGVIKDDPQSIRNALSLAAEKADFIISTGGVSVGAADHIKTILAEIGNMIFWKVAIKPGRPLTFGRINDRLFMGLPGNPVAVMVTFNQFVIPAIWQLSGADAKTPLKLRACSQDRIGKKMGRFEVQRGIADCNAAGLWQVRKTGSQGSGILTSMSKANCFILLPPESTDVEVGDEVDIQLFDWY